MSTALRLHGEHGPRRLLRVSDVAAWLDVAPRTIYRLPIPFVPIGRRGRRYRAEDVETYIRRVLTTQEETR